ncbi:PEPxxWA-CTERM sorting domain-containing protein [Phenylobacterium sp.]|uniref:PEPxxWA-CTERM sorting domain-containing protein n=1 Tax=Phenylobacterium sp. TaxID=1871053 RepID=UPI0025CEAD09|nr:PEPxxWA-CTERM sorting domain-containing protein [Phenylobacterium sp.]
MKIREFAAVATGAMALAASLVLAGPASATVHNLTYKGVVTSALDSTGEFGAGANLIGKAFTAKVVYDDAKDGPVHWGGVYYDYLSGDGADNPVTATIQLNGVTKSFGATSGYDERLDRTLQPGCMFDCTDADFQQNATDRYTVGGLYTLNYINLGGISSDGSLSGLAHTAPNFTNPPIQLYAFVNLFQQDIFTLESRHSAEVGVRIDSVGGGVPEPGVWALMLLGFGGAGTMLRRRRALAAVATA